MKSAFIACGRSDKVLLGYHVMNSTYTGLYPSPKFYQKIQYCSTLSELARHVPLTQIDLPPEIYQSVTFVRL